MLKVNENRTELNWTLEASDSVDSMWTSGSWFEHVEQQYAPIRRAITTSLILDNRRAPQIEWTGTTPRDLSLWFINRVHRGAMVELIIDANVWIPSSQPDRHDNPPQDTPQNTELEDTNWVHRLFIPEVTEQETMCFTNIDTYTTCNPFDLDEIHDPSIFPEHSKRMHQSAPVMNLKHKKASWLTPVSSAHRVTVRAPGLLDWEQLITRMHLPALSGSTTYNNTTLCYLLLLVKASCIDGFMMTRVDMTRV